MYRGLGPELQKGLHPVTAPPDLWDRIQTPKAAPPGGSNRRLVWALAAMVVVAVMALSVLQARRESFAGDESFALQMLNSDSQRIAFHCQNPSQLRAWVRARTGFDLPLRAESSPSIQLIGAQTIGGSRGVEVAYRAGNRDAVLVVSRAEAGSAEPSHRRVSGNISSWVMDGQRYTLACNNPADLQLACKLCHLD
jgi:hypothetical protein